MNTRYYSISTLLHRSEGIVLVETLLVVPILVFIFALTLHFTSVYYVTSSLEKSARVAARQLARGQFDEETAGINTPCTQLTNTTASGKPSAEYLACDLINFGFNNLSVSAFDGNAMGTTSVGTAVYVELQIPRTELLTLVPEAVAIGPEYYLARTTMYGEVSNE